MLKSEHPKYNCDGSLPPATQNTAPGSAKDLVILTDETAASPAGASAGVSVSSINSLPVY
jgi:hypothetical protein